MATCENILAKFTGMAKSGDQVYIHYSVRGGRTNTADANPKGASRLDEALVPPDIGSSEARYLRDVEMAHLLKTTVDKGLIVTVLLDSCHSGGAAHGACDTVARPAVAGPAVGAPIDTTPRPTRSDVALLHELAAT